MRDRNQWKAQKLGLLAILLRPKLWNKRNDLLLNNDCLKVAERLLERGIFRTKSLSVFFQQTFLPRGDDSTFPARPRSAVYGLHLAKNRRRTYVHTYTAIKWTKTTYHQGIPISSYCRANLSFSWGGGRGGRGGVTAFNMWWTLFLFFNNETTIKSRLDGCFGSHAIPSNRDTRCREEKEKKIAGKLP